MLDNKPSPVFLNVYGAQESIPRHEFRQSFFLAGRYDNPIPTRFLAPIDCLKIPFLVIQCVDRKLKAADQLIYAEDDDMLHVAFIATNVNRCENYLNHQYILSEPFKTKSH
jgi:hypothetical protein